MGLKQLIKQQKIAAMGASNAVYVPELVLPGEPMIYSIKYQVGKRRRGAHFFRDMKWKSILKSFFRSYYNTSTPVVILVRFYVTPPERAKVKAADLKKESVPAVRSYEVCDYLLSFLDMLMHVLFNSYRQVVKIEVDKFYSNDPRTVFKYMRWEDYVNIENNNTMDAKAKRKLENLRSRTV